MRLGDYIEMRHENNSSLKYGVELIEGINNSGEFQSTKAITDDINLKPYKVVRHGDIVYNPSRLNIGSLAYRTGGMCIVSHLYQVFFVKEECSSVLSAEFLTLYLRRSEFYRYVDYDNFGSQRAEYNLRKLSELQIPLPSPSEQQKVVNAWKALREIKEQNEAIAAPLMQVCQSYIQELKHQYDGVEIGPYIVRSDKRNSDNGVKIVKSVSVTKEFNDTNAKVDKSNLGAYKIVAPNQISFVQTTGNEKCLCAAINHFGYPIVVTSVNEVFETDDKVINPDFLHLWFRRKELDRYARFHSWGSARETFTWDDMKRVRIPLPPPSVQQAIVNIYNCANEAKWIAAEADRMSREVCPALIQHVIHNL